MTIARARRITSLALIVALWGSLALLVIIATIPVVPPADPAVAPVAMAR